MVLVWKTNILFMQQSRSVLRFLLEQLQKLTYTVRPMLFTRKKICSRCSVSKEMDKFHADKRTPDGKTNVCGACRNAAKKSRNRSKVLPAPTVAKTSVKITSEQTNDELSMFRALSDKFNAHYSVSIDKNGNARLQVHQKDITRTWKGTVDSVFEKALAY
jgi:hypothetical protein